MAVNTDGLQHCVHCGAVTDADHAFCPYCGTPLTEPVYDEAAGTVSSAGRNPLIGAGDPVSRAKFIDSMNVSEPDEDSDSMTRWGRAMDRAEAGLKIASQRREEKEAQARIAAEHTPDFDQSDNPSDWLTGQFMISRQLEAELLQAKDDERAAQARVDRFMAEADAADKWFRLSGDGPPAEGPWR
jgi:zinc-ribbon domain